MAGDKAAKPVVPTVRPTKALSIFDNNGLAIKIPNAGRANFNISRFELLELERDDLLLLERLPELLDEILISFFSSSSPSSSSFAEDEEDTTSGGIQLLLLLLLLFDRSSRPLFCRTNTDDDPAGTV